MLQLRNLLMVSSRPRLDDETTDRGRGSDPPAKNAPRIYNCLIAPANDCIDATQNSTGNQTRSRLRGPCSALRADARPVPLTGDVFHDRAIRKRTLVAWHCAALTSESTLCEHFGPGIFTIVFSTALSSHITVQIFFRATFQVLSLCSYSSHSVRHSTPQTINPKP